MANNLDKKDPAKAPGFIGAKKTLTAAPADVREALAVRNDLVVVDVRAAQDYAQGHIPGAVNLPQEQWSSGAGLDKDKLNVVYCYSHACHLAGAACAELAGRGYPVVEMDGGFDIWQSSEFEVEQ